MRKLLLGLVGVSGLALASAANATLSIVPPTTVSNPPSNPLTTPDSGFHYTFGYNDTSATNPFEQLISFMNTAGGYYGMGVQTTATLVPNPTTGLMQIDPATDVDFTNVFISSICPAGSTATPGSCGLGALPGGTFTNTSNGDVHEDYELSGLYLPAGSYTIHILGSRGNASSFEGNVNFAAGTPNVPEPATWAMMLLGFGAVGWQLRRRRTSLLPQVA